MGSFLLVLVLKVELHRLVRVVGFKLVDIVEEVRAVGVHGFKHLQVLSVRSLLATIIMGYAAGFGNTLFFAHNSFTTQKKKKRELFKVPLHSPTRCELSLIFPWAVHPCESSPSLDAQYPNH